MVASTETCELELKGPLCEFLAILQQPLPEAPPTAAAAAAPLSKLLPGHPPASALAHLTSRRWLADHCASIVSNVRSQMRAPMPSSLLHAKFPSVKRAVRDLTVLAERQ